MKKKISRTRPAAALAALFCAAAFLLGSLASSQSEAGPVSAGFTCPQQGGTVNIGMWSAPDTFIPHYAVTNYGKYIGHQLFHGLYTYNENLDLIPLLAHDVEIDETGTQYTFSLRDDVLWHDGEPFTAEDVAFTYSLLLHPEYDGTRTANVIGIKGGEAYRAGESESIEGIEVIDDHTIRIVTEDPDAVFMEAVAKEIWILPEHILRDFEVPGLGRSSFAQMPLVGTGPFKFERYAEGQYIQLGRFDGYFLNEPCLDSVVVKIVSPSIALAQLQSGELDITAGTGIGSLEPRDVDRVAQIPNVETVIYTTSGIQVMNINLRKPYLEDKRVRQAFAHAIDRQAMVDHLLMGYGEAANGPLTSGDAFYNPDMPIFEYNPDRARELLEEAGWDFSRKLLLMYPSGNRVRELSAPVIQANLQQIGVQVELSMVDFAAQSAAATDGVPDLWLSGSYLPLIDPQTILYSYHSSQIPPAGFNMVHFRNERIDKLLDTTARTLDQEQRHEMFAEFQSILADEQPDVPLYFAQAIDAVSERLMNAHPGPWDASWNLSTWYIKE